MNSSFRIWLAFMVHSMWQNSYICCRRSASGRTLQLFKFSVFTVDSKEFSSQLHYVMESQNTWDFEILRLKFNTIIILSFFYCMGGISFDVVTEICDGWHESYLSTAITRTWQCGGPIQQRIAVLRLCTCCSSAAFFLLQWGEFFSSPGIRMNRETARLIGFLDSKTGANPLQHMRAHDFRKCVPQTVITDWLRNFRYSRQLRVTSTVDNDINFSLLFHTTAVEHSTHAHVCYTSPKSCLTLLNLIFGCSNLATLITVSDQG